MEMRTILANVFYKFNLELSEPYSDENVKKNGGLENLGATMGPCDMTPEGLETTRRRMLGEIEPNKPKMGMHLHCVPRAKPKLQNEKKIRKVKTNTNKFKKRTKKIKYFE